MNARAFQVRPSVSRRRGVTLIEVIAATAMLALIASGIFTILNNMFTSQWRQQQQLAASELAGRMIILYLDDTFEMPKRSQLLDWGKDRFRWDYREDPIELVEVGKEERKSNRTMGLPQDRCKMLTVRVWLSEESGGSYSYTDIVPHCKLTRLVDPFAIRNNDAFERLTQSDNYTQFLMEMMGGGGGGGGGRGSSPAPSGGRGGGSGSGGRSTGGASR